MVLISAWDRQVTGNDRDEFGKPFKILRIHLPSMTICEVTKYFETEADMLFGVDTWNEATGNTDWKYFAVSKIEKGK